MSASSPGEPTSKPGRQSPDDGFPGLPHTLALIAVVAGAAGSIGFMLSVGTRNDSSIPFVLLVLFTGWVLSPFLALVLADIRFKRWPASTRAALHRVMLLLALGSLAIYGYVAFSPPMPKPASVFLLVPLGSWLLMTIVATAARLSRRRDGA